MTVIDQIIVTGVASTEFSRALDAANRVFKMNPKIVPVHNGQFSSFTLLLNRDVDLHFYTCSDFCEGICESNNLRVVWSTLTYDEQSRRLDVQENVIFDSDYSCV